MIASCGQIVVPIAVQQTLDRGLNGPGGPRLDYVVWMGVLAAVAIVVTSVASYLMTSRLFTTSERGLATLRTKAFRHVHDLPLLTQNTERRGALVSRVTSDVDQVSQFLVFGGLIFVVSIGQMLVATVLMVVYSWELALVVWLCFAPLFLSIRWFQKKLSAAYSVVRHQVGVLLGAISEPVVGAAVVRSYGVEDRTQARIDTAIQDWQDAYTHAQTYTVTSFSLGGLSAGLANAGVIVIGVLLGFTGDMTAGRGAGLRVPGDAVRRAGADGHPDPHRRAERHRQLAPRARHPRDAGRPRRPRPRRARSCRAVRSTSASPTSPSPTPTGRRCCATVDLAIDAGTRVAIVGETGSGKSTFAKLLTRLMDPTDGAVLLDGVDVRRIDARSLRAQRRAGAAGGLPLRRHDRRQRALRQARRHRGRDPRLGRRARRRRLARAACRAGCDTQVGQRGESLSAGERQLVALLRAHLADPDLLVLDEATSAVDPALEMQIGRALERLMQSRTSVTIAHRLSTAENADEVIVVDKGRVVQRGPHAELVTQAGSVYAGLHASWVAQHSRRVDPRSAWRRSLRRPGPG